MKTYYTTGRFAKMANTTERTIRYYDKVGLLKPTFIASNGYRNYGEEDLVKLQRILSLRNLGFSIEEIFTMLVISGENLAASFLQQSELIQKKITQYQVLNDSLKKAAKLFEQGQLEWDKVVDLIRLTNVESSLVEQYRNAANLDARIHLHNRFSTNTTDWFTWLFTKINFVGVYRLLEVGCGNGKLWENKAMNLRNREIFLSDSSLGMVDEVRKKLGDEFNCIVVECENIPFKNAYFDALVANHVLFYLKDVQLGLEEITRVLKPKGMLYCTTYGKDHMKEIRELVIEFDNRIYLSETNLYDNFGLENGFAILSKYFSHVECVHYPDTLRIDEVQPLMEYILSCHGNQNEIIGKRVEEFTQFLKKKMEKKGYIEITKNAGLFICKK